MRGLKRELQKKGVDVKLDFRRNNGFKILVLNPLLPNNDLISLYVSKINPYTLVNSSDSDFYSIHDDHLLVRELSLIGLSENGISLDPLEVEQQERVKDGYCFYKVVHKSNLTSVVSDYINCVLSILEEKDRNERD